MSLPLISCICVTRGRPLLLRRAIRCFMAQSYANKELIILTEDDDVLSIAVLKELTAEEAQQVQVHIMDRQKGYRLGMLRNHAIARAKGHYVCQWDDDDWYHPERLRLQHDAVQAQQNALGCVLTQWIIYDAVERKAYLSGYRNWEGSLLCDREFAMTYPYQDLAKGEDTPLVEALQHQGKLYALMHRAWLYIYSFHGANTWDRNHFKGFIYYSQPLPYAVNEGIVRLMEGNDTDMASGLLSLSDHFII